MAKTRTIVRDFQVRLRSVEKRLRKVESELEMLPAITSFKTWRSLTERDQAILTALYKYELEGASTLALAKDLDLNKPETSGRTIIARRLRSIQKISVKLKGAPVVIRQGRNWALNFEDYIIELKDHED